MVNKPLILTITAPLASILCLPGRRRERLRVRRAFRLAIEAAGGVSLQSAQGRPWGRQKHNWPAAGGARTDIAQGCAALRGQGRAIASREQERAKEKLAVTQRFLSEKMCAVLPT